MDYHSLPRKELQLLCKKHGIPANKTNVFMADALAKKRVPLSDISVNREAGNDLFSVTPLKVAAANGKVNDTNAALFNNTPFLRRGSKKKGAPPRSSNGAEKADVKPSTTGAHKQPVGNKIGAFVTTTANAKVVGNEKRGGKISTHQNSVNRAFEQADSGSNDCFILEIRRSSSESSFTSPDQEDSQPKKVENLEIEAGFDNKPQTDVGRGTNVEGNQRGGSEPGRPQTPPGERYIVKVTFADEVIATDQGSGGAKKVKPDEFKLRRTDTSSITNGGYTVKSKLDTRPATNWPFVFRATRQEETKPRNSKTATRDTSDLKTRAESKASTAGALKQEESKTTRAVSEGKEGSAVAKVKPEAKASAAPGSTSYAKPSKRARLGSGSTVANDLEGTVGKVHSSPTKPNVEAADSFEFPATCSEFKVLDLPEWAKEFKRQRKDTLSSAADHTPDKSTHVEMVTSPAPGLSGLKNIEDKVVKLLDRLKGFSWKGEAETEAANGVVTAVEAADQVEVE